MTAKFQLVIDCADPEPLARFWVAALSAPPSALPGRRSHDRVDKSVLQPRFVHTI
jgi:hypothetical protein